MAARLEASASAGARGTGLVGRRHELALIAELLSGVDGCGAVLLLDGPPGVGKSSILAHAADAARQHRMSVARVSGVASEAALPFAAAADLLAPFISGYAELLPAGQRGTLERCFAPGGSPAAGGPYAAYLAALSLLTRAAEHDPVVMAVDDLQWVDDASQRMLAFLARRIDADRVIMLLAAREVPALWHGIDAVRRLTLAGLEEADCATLLERAGAPVAAGVLPALTELTAGNPLVLVETARQLLPDQRTGSRSLPDRPALGGRLADAWSERLGALPTESQQALLVIAAHHSTGEVALESAMRAFGLPESVLQPALEAGLVTRTSAGLELFHPLFRAFLLSTASGAARRRTYTVLAGTAGAESKAWYLAAASDAPDEVVARMLDETAAAARSRNGFAAAALAMKRAADLTADRERRSVRLRAAAADALMAGSLDDVRRYCLVGLALNPAPLVKADLLLLQGRAEMWLGEVARARELMLQAVEEVEPLEPSRAVQMLGEATLPSVMASRIPDALQIVDRSLPLIAQHGAGGETCTLIAQSMLCGGRVAEGMHMLERALADVEASDALLAQSGLSIAGQCLTWTEQFGPARRLLTRVVDHARLAQAPSLLPYALTALSELDRWAGRWPAAYANASEALQWAVELGQAGTAGYSLACLARLDAARGDTELCRERIRQVQRAVQGLQLRSLETYAESALGLAALGAGQTEAAVGQLRAAHQLACDFHLTPTIVPYGGDLVEALVRTGNNDEAAEVAVWLDGFSTESALVWPAAIAAACRGLLADDLDEADALFARATAALRDLDLPFERARVWLWRGEKLRRGRRAGAARLSLRPALATFHALGARPWAERAAAELAAVGERVAPTRREAWVDTLTPQELQVAQLAASGLNNVEAAAALFMSRKTVEAHLTRSYRKLGIRSRIDLARLLATAERPAP